jgi:hypothetical protein
VIGYAVEFTLAVKASVTQTVNSVE